MLKLFRNIRKNLIQEGKTTNYLKYAIGEIVLVVIGILIALQINNWNISKAEKKVEKEFITSLIEDLQTDSFRLSQNIDHFQSKIIKIDTVLRMFKILNKGYNDTLRRNLKEVKNYKDFIYTDRTMQQLKNSGGMRLITNKKAANGILDYDLSMRHLLESLQPDLLFYYEKSNEMWFEIVDKDDFERDKLFLSITEMEAGSKNYLLKSDKENLGKFNNIIREFQNDLIIVKDRKLLLKQKANNLVALLKNEYDIQ